VSTDARPEPYPNWLKKQTFRYENVKLDQPETKCQFSAAMLSMSLLELKCVDLVVPQLYRQLKDIWSENR
jgi:hypothetical protein